MQQTSQSRRSSGRFVSRLTGGTLAIIMAGGRGERLRDLTERRCKPATPFGGKFRIIDFVLSNCVNSGIRQIAVLTQYKAQSLIQHVQRGWSYLRGEFGEFIDVIPAQQQVGEHWYRGTADAVFQNLDYIRDHRPTHVLVLAGDHVYKMDYSVMLEEHVVQGAELSVACLEVPLQDASDFGVMAVDTEQRIVAYHECGHAIAASALPLSDPVQKVSIIPRGIGALGYTLQVPLADRYLMTRSELLAKIGALLGGRAAEIGPAEAAVEGFRKLASTGALA
jgi:ADP-glucose pyrophosphorylase